MQRSLRTFLKAERRSLLFVTALWLALRVLSLVGLALLSSQRPMTAVEESVPLWPPSQPLGTWLARVALYPSLRWDAHYYLRIVERGYSVTDGTAQFHPLYPLLARPFALLGAHPLFALLLVSSAASLVLAYLVYAYAKADHRPQVALASTLLMLTSPFGVALFVPYPEGLFLVAAVACLLALRRQRWALAGLMGALAVLTRQQGLLLALPMAVAVWREGRGGVPRREAFKRWAALLPIPAAYAGWIAYRALALADVELSDWSFHDLVYGVLVSPSAAQVVPVQSFIWPWRLLRLALTQLVQRPDVDLVVNLSTGLVFVALVVWVWRDLDWPSRAYVLAVALVSFSYYTGPVHPLMGLPRHLLLAFPVFAALGKRLQSNAARIVAVGLSFLVQYFLLLLYSLEAWVL